MFAQLGEIPYESCKGKYVRVQAIIQGIAPDQAMQDEIYKVLWRYGGRCDCTVDRNVVRPAAVREAADKEIKAILEKRS